jgi:hypothetical protein
MSVKDLICLTFCCLRMKHGCSGYTYSANSKIWSAEKPHEMHEDPLHLWKFGGGCEMPRNIIVVPPLCEESLTDESYQKILNHSFFCCKRKKRIVGFWKMRANVQISKTKTAVLENCLCARMVGCGLWPLWSPRLTTPDLLLWGFRKERVYSSAGETFWGRMPKLPINF